MPSRRPIYVWYRWHPGCELDEQGFCRHENAQTWNTECRLCSWVDSDAMTWSQTEAIERGLRHLRYCREEQSHG